CAAINGWADPNIIDAYEAERQPITDQVSKLAMRKMEEFVAATSKRSMPKAISWNNPIGALLRRRVGRKLFDLNIPQFAPEGLNYGYYYERSPIIEADGEAAPAYDMGSCTPSTAPGCRMPHFFVERRSILDIIGPDYTLLQFEGSPA